MFQTEKKIKSICCCSHPIIKKIPFTIIFCATEIMGWALKLLVVGCAHSAHPLAMPKSKIQNGMSSVRDWLRRWRVTPLRRKFKLDSWTQDIFHLVAE